jgi:hypothetical protein
MHLMDEAYDDFTAHGQLGRHRSSTLDQSQQQREREGERKRETPEAWVSRKRSSPYRAGIKIHLPKRLGLHALFWRGKSRGVGFLCTRSTGVLNWLSSQGWPVINLLERLN